MKTKLLFPVIAFMLLSLSCKKEPCNKPPQLTNAVITGYDMRKCACCGGLLLNFNENPDNYSEDYYVVDKLPADFVIKDNEFPIYVKIKSHEVPATCGIRHIEVTQIVRR